MTKEIKGLKLGPMKSLGRILEEWTSLMKDSEWGKDDTPWWYNERALLSLFAGAVWKCGGWAFEEFATSKRTIAKRVRHNRSPGRGDLMFGIGNDTFIAEAKQCWPILGYKNLSATRNIVEALRKARVQSSRLPSDGKKLGIVFAVPRLRESKGKDSEEILCDLERHLHLLKNTTITWVFPKEKRILKGGDGFLYPGVVLAMKPLRIRNSS